MVVKYDPDFTNSVIAATGAKVRSQLMEIMPALNRHVHDFAREVHLTSDEHMACVAMINWAGQMSNDRRNEGQLLTDVIGLESLVDEITYKTAAAAASSARLSAILGPFWRSDAPVCKNGESIILAPPVDGKIAYVHRIVSALSTGKPITNALVDLWQASTNVRSCNVFIMKLQIY